MFRSMGRHTVSALTLIALACDSPTEVEVETWVQLGQVAAVKLKSVVDREINLAITTEGSGCLKSPGRTEVAIEGTMIDIMPFDTMSSIGGVCTSIRLAFTREVSVVVPNPGNFTANITGIGPLGDTTTTTIRDIVVK